MAPPPDGEHRAAKTPDGENPAAEAFFGAAMAGFVAACGQHAPGDAPGELWLRIARRTVCLRFAGDRMRQVVAPVFAHLESTAQQSAELTILLWDTASTGVDPPPLAWRRRDLDRAGRVGHFCDARFATVHEPEAGQLWVLDRRSATAMVWVSDMAALPVWDHIHPLRKLLHVWARGFGADLVHAGAVGVGGAGLLVVGPGGTGKSTTVLAAMAAGLSAAGDDYVLIEAASLPGSRAAGGSPAAGPPPTAHALYGTMRLHQTHLERFPTLMSHHDHVFEEPWSGRAKVTSYISRHRPDRLTAELRLVGIVIPQVVDDDAREITPATPAQALLALAPSSVLQVDPTDAAMFARLGRLCRALPCWRLPLGPDLARVGERLMRLIREAV